MASNVLKRAFASVCDSGKVRPELYTVAAMSENFSNNLADTLASISSNQVKASEASLKNAPYLTSVVTSLQGQASGILAQQPAFTAHVQALKDNPDAPPRERMLNAMGAIEGVCQAEGRLTGAFTDTMNGIDRKKAAAEFNTIQSTVPGFGSSAPGFNFGR